MAARHRGGGKPPDEAGRERVRARAPRRRRERLANAGREPTPAAPLPEVLAGASRHLIAGAVFLAATLAMFADVLASGNRIVSGVGEDLASVFLYWHAFGFGELAQGNLALWNPHTFSGAPFFGGFQPALLYPPNWLHLILPLGPAFNLGVALHCFLAGLFVYCWTDRRGLHPAACVFAGLTFMFSGAYFLQIYRGHLPNLRTIVWAPLILLAIDGLLAAGTARWLLLGSAAVALQILAGHPQYVLYTAVVVGLYALAGWAVSPRRWHTAAALVAVYPLGASLAAVQLLPGLDATTESLRSTLEYTIARTYALPPENVLTLVLPDVFGDMVTTPYWGRWTLSETSLYVGVVGFFFAVCGIVHGERRETRIALGLALVALVLSFGYYTPLFRFLYDYVPGFGAFRGIAKFNALCTLFLALLAAIGFDRLLQAPVLPQWPLPVLLAAGVLLVATAAIVSTSASGGAGGAWATWLGALDLDDEAYRYHPVERGGDFALVAGRAAARSLLWGGGSALVLAALWWSTRHTRAALWGIALLGVVQLFAYAAQSRPTFDPAPYFAYDVTLRELLAERPGDYRIIDANPYFAMGAGARDLWGNDPMILGRYAELLAFTQDTTPTQMITRGITQLSPLFSLLRLRYVLRRDLQPSPEFQSPIGEIPRALLVDRARVFTERHEMLAAMADPSFDPRAVVFLEAAPDPVPVESDRKGSVSVVDVSTDALEIHADLPAPAVLLVTDNYARGWRARALDPASTERYRVVPADYTLRAIALGAGRHDLLLEYAPASFRIGAWLTGLAILGHIGAGVWVLRQRRQRAVASLTLDPAGS